MSCSRKEIKFIIEALNVRAVRTHQTRAFFTVFLKMHEIGAFPQNRTIMEQSCAGANQVDLAGRTILESFASKFQVGSGRWLRILSWHGYCLTS
jgi:hypothetical protein